jgi:RNA polymerase sigma factor (sigma-70 family)
MGRGSIEDVEDVMADAYVAAASRLRSDPTLQIENMLGWFRRVLFLTCLDYSRRYRRAHAGLVRALQYEDDSLDLIAGAHPAFDLKAALAEALGRLPAEDRTIVTMAAAGHTSDEIAKTLVPQMTPDSVRKRKSRVLANLQKALGGIETWIK